MSTPEVVKFSNERARRVADTLHSAYLSAQRVVQEWDDRGLSSSVAATDDPIDDGAASDGRAPMTGNKLIALVEYCRSFVGRADFNTGADRVKYSSVAVNGRAI